MSTKSDFPIGTRVRVIAFQHEAPRNEKIGKTGTVVDPDIGSRFIFVDLDDADLIPRFPLLPSEIEAIPIEPATSTAATLRAQADALDAESKAAREEAHALQQRINDLIEKDFTTTSLAAQYRNVASDLEARS